jgi:hypothetical protein
MLNNVLNNDGVSAEQLKHIHCHRVEGRDWNHVPSVLILHIGTKRDSPELLTNNICYKNGLPLPVKIAVGQMFANDGEK